MPLTAIALMSRFRILLTSLWACSTTFFLLTVTIVQAGELPPTFVGSWSTPKPCGGDPEELLIVKITNTMKGECSIVSVGPLEQNNHIDHNLQPVTLKCIGNDGIPYTTVERWTVVNENEIYIGPYGESGGSEFYRCSNQTKHKTKNVYFSREGITIPEDDVTVWLWSEFSVDSVMAILRGRGGYGIEFIISENDAEDGAPEFISILFGGTEIATIGGSLKEKKIYKISSSIEGAISPSGVRVGDAVAEKVGRKLTCGDLHFDCADPRIPEISYYVDDDRCADHPILQGEMYLITCGIVNKIELASKNSAQ